MVQQILTIWYNLGKIDIVLQELLFQLKIVKDCGIIKCGWGRSPTAPSKVVQTLVPQNRKQKTED